MVGVEKWEYTMFQETFGMISTDQEKLWKDYSGRIRDLGLLGWELVSVATTQFGIGFYFKRPLPTKEETFWPSPE